MPKCIEKLQNYCLWIIDQINDQIISSSVSINNKLNNNSYEQSKLFSMSFEDTH
jgi:hypothetical protein